MLQREAFLEEALKSALEQTFPPEEILVVDDGSRDASREIARSMGPRVVVLEQAHRGPGAARNLGADRAKGDFVAFLDADDIYIREKLALQARLLQERPDVDVVYTSHYVLETDGSTTIVQAREPDVARERLPYECPLYPSTVVARTEILRSERWNEELGSSEDWDLFYRLSKRCVLASIPRPTMYYRQHPESLSTKNWAKVLANAIKVSNAIQCDYSGLSGLKRRRMVDARLWTNAAIAARQSGSTEALVNVVRSLAAWPLPGLGHKRYKLFGSMLIDRVSGVSTRARPDGEHAEGPRSTITRPE